MTTLTIQLNVNLPEALLGLLASFVQKLAPQPPYGQVTAPAQVAPHVAPPTVATTTAKPADLTQVAQIAPVAPQTPTVVHAAAPVFSAKEMKDATAIAIQTSRVSLDQLRKIFTDFGVTHAGAVKPEDSFKFMSAIGALPA